MNRKFRLIVVAFSVPFCCLPPPAPHNYICLVCNCNSYHIVPPMLSIPNQLEAAYQGQDITLECQTEAYPASINYWTTEKGDMIISGECCWSIWFQFFFFAFDIFMALDAVRMWISILYTRKAVYFFPKFTRRCYQHHHQLFTFERKSVAQTKSIFVFILCTPTHWLAYDKQQIALIQCCFKVSLSHAQQT